MAQAKTAIAAPTSRRNFMKNAVATVAALVLPVAAMAKPPASPRERLFLKIEELKAAAKEFNPSIDDWIVKVAEGPDDGGGRCSILVTAFDGDDVTGTTA